MKTADEMFFELGYEKYDNHPEEDFPPEPNMFTTQDVRRLYYEEKGTLRIGVEGLEHIEFDLIKKNVVCWARINGRFTIVPLSIKELQAINKKIEELDIAISECIYLDEDDEKYKKAVEKDKLCLLNQKRALQELLEGGQS